jgi:hypothetical protein
VTSWASTTQSGAPAATKRKRKSGRASKPSCDPARQQAELELERERREGKRAGAGALLSVGCWLGALVATNAAGVGASTAAHPGGGLGQIQPVNRAHELLAVHHSGADQALAAGLRCAGLLLSAAVGVYLCRLIQARAAERARRLPLLAVGGALLVSVSTLLGALALHHVATEFAASGARTTARATRLMDGSGTLELAAVADLVSRVVLATWVALSSLGMMRVGLLDRFLAYWGFAACGALVLALPVGDAMFIAWLGSIGILALGYWPGGRPEAWRRISQQSN